MNNEDYGGKNEKRRLHSSQWEEIFVSQYSGLMAIARKFTNSNDFSPEDLVQDTICRVIFYSPDPAKIKNTSSYLSRTLTNLRIDKWKKVQGLIMQSLDDETNTTLANEIPSVAPTALRTLENEDLRRELRIVTRNLKPLEKEVFNLFLKGYDCKEIAAKLNESPYLITYVLNAVRAKIRFRVNKLKGNWD